MKKSILIIASLFLLVFVACNDQEKKEDAKEQTEKGEGTYECPMKCEGSKSDKPGKCPMCGMDLEKADSNKDANHQEHSDSSGHENHDH